MNSEDTPLLSTMMKTVRSNMVKQRPPWIQTQIDAGYQPHSFVVEYVSTTPCGHLCGHRLSRPPQQAKKSPLPQQALKSSLPLSLSKYSSTMQTRQEETQATQRPLQHLRRTSTTGKKRDTIGTTLSPSHLRKTSSKDLTPTMLHNEEVTDMELGTTVPLLYQDDTALTHRRNTTATKSLTAATTGTSEVQESLLTGKLSIQKSPATVHTMTTSDWSEHYSGMHASTTALTMSTTISNLEVSESRTSADIVAVTDLDTYSNTVLVKRSDGSDNDSPDIGSDLKDIETVAVSSKDPEYFQQNHTSSMEASSTWYDTFFSFHISKNPALLDSAKTKLQNEQTGEIKQLLDNTHNHMNTQHTQRDDMDHSKHLTHGPQNTHHLPITSKRPPLSPNSATSQISSLTAMQSMSADQTRQKYTTQPQTTINTSYKSQKSNTVDQTHALTHALTAQPSLAVWPNASTTSSDNHHKLAPPVSHLSTPQLTTVTVAIIVAFWLMLGPLVCIICRIHDKNTNKRQKSCHQKYTHRLLVNNWRSLAVDRKNKMYTAVNIEPEQLPLSTPENHHSTACSTMNTNNTSSKTNGTSPVQCDNGYLLRECVISQSKNMSRNHKNHQTLTIPAPKQTSFYCHHNISTVARPTPGQTSSYCYNNVSTVDRSTPGLTSSYCHNNVSTVDRSTPGLTSSYCHHNVSTVDRSTPGQISSYCHQNVSTMDRSMPQQTSRYCEHNVTIVDWSRPRQTSSYCDHCVSTTNRSTVIK